MAAGNGARGAGTTSCPNCHKRYPWRDSLEGKKVKCKCGNVFEAALDLEGALPDHDDRTYDVAADYVPPMEPRAMSTTAPIMPAEIGSVASAYPQRRSGKVLTYAHATPAEAADIRERSMLREWYLPLGLLGVGLMCYVAQIVFSSDAAGTTAAGQAGAAFLGILLEIGLILAGVGISSKLMSIDFGPIPELLLKIMATAVLGAALWALTVSIFPKDDMNGPIIALHVVVILYWVLFYTFFEMDLQECLMTVAIITAFHIAAFCIVFKPMG
ncbi:MAG TPA: hypothetical protein VGR35_05980 [Tepidisphaeraceae bacterium]|nr:hypothetical protein [Tepidisphaeraceae bacterium]